jgi:hypothetical protein
MNTIRLLLAGCSLLLVAGCSKQAAASGNSGAAPAPAAMGPELMAKLAKADTADGTTDKIVHKCAGCALGMDGKADHAVKVGEYTLHLCDGCWAGGKADGMAMAAKLPAK